MIVALTLLVALAGPVVVDAGAEADAPVGFFEDRGRVATVTGILAGSVVGAVAGLTYDVVRERPAPLPDEVTALQPWATVFTTPLTWGLLAGAGIGGFVGAAIGGEPTKTVLAAGFGPPLAAAVFSVVFFSAAVIAILPIAVAGIIIAALVGAGPAAGAVGVVAGIGLFAALGVTIAALTGDAIVTAMRPPRPRPPPSWASPPASVSPAIEAPSSTSPTTPPTTTPTTPPGDAPPAPVGDVAPPVEDPATPTPVDPSE